MNCFRGPLQEKDKEEEEEPLAKYLVPSKEVKVRVERHTRTTERSIPEVPVQKKADAAKHALAGDLNASMIIVEWVSEKKNKITTDKQVRFANASKESTQVSTTDHGVTVAVNGEQENSINQLPMDSLLAPTIHSTRLIEKKIQTLSYKQFDEELAHPLVQQQAATEAAKVGYLSGRLLS